MQAFVGKPHCSDEMQTNKVVMQPYKTEQAHSAKQRPSRHELLYFIQVLACIRAYDSFDDLTDLRTVRRTFKSEK